MNRYSTILLNELGAQSLHGADLAAKIGELYTTFSQFDVLFSDYSANDVVLFTNMFMDPRSVWVEVYEDDVAVGVMYLTEVNPYWDAFAHLSFWDKVFVGREPVIFDTVEWAMDRYKLHRMSAEIPVTLSKYIHYVEKRLGFKKEGIKREGTIKEGERIDLQEMGLLRQDLKEARMKWAVRQAASAPVLIPTT